MTVAELASSGPAPFGLDMNHDGQVYARNLPLFALAPVLAYFAWQRRLNVRAVAVVAGALTLAAVVMNAYPFEADGDTVILATLHLALALWLVVGVAYVGGDWRNGQRRMDFIRFTGEAFIYMVLIGLGGVVLLGILAGTFRAIHIDTNIVIAQWLAPCGGPAAPVVAAWLVEAKQSVIENMAPVLIRLFTPLFAGVLIAIFGRTADSYGFTANRTAALGQNVLLLVNLV